MNIGQIIGVFWGRYKFFIYAALAAAFFVWASVKVNNYISYKIDQATTSLRNSILSGIQKDIQGTLDERLDSLQSNLNANFDAIDKSLKDAKQNIDDQRDQLDSIGDVWLRVDAVKGTEPNTGNKDQGSNTANSVSGSDGTSYAKLSKSHVQFLTGEAYRADQCAVRLGAAQEALIQYKGAFELYQKYVNEALVKAKTANDAK